MTDLGFFKDQIVYALCQSSNNYFGLTMFAFLSKLELPNITSFIVNYL